MADKPQYYECPHCSCYHIVGFTGNCDDPDVAFIDSELDDLHGVGGWEEIFGENTDPEAAAIHRHKNLDRIAALTEDTDIEGNKLEPGCLVRCFEANYDPEHDWLLGMEIIGKGVTYSEGKLLAIKNHYEKRPEMTGRYYEIAITKHVGPLITRSNSNFEVSGTTQTTHYRDGQSFPMYILVNGSESGGMRTFGVVRI